MSMQLLTEEQFEEELWHHQAKLGVLGAASMTACAAHLAELWKDQEKVDVTEALVTIVAMAEHLVKKTMNL
jgi:hypothetical protein